MSAKKAGKDNTVFMESISLDSLSASNSIPDRELDGYYEALDLAFEAFDQPTKAKRIAMAKKSLALSPYMVDAHLLLIRENIQNLDAKIAACIKAIELGKTFIGKESLKDFHGELWMNMDARPTLRAVHTLAHLYLDKNDREKAAETYRTILDMNANDNQGVRYEFLPLLIRTKNWAETQKLYQRYKSDYIAAWHFLGALPDFALGNEPGAARKVDKAHKMNPHFLPYLTAEKPLPDDEGVLGYYSPGDETEVMAFIEDIHASWEATEGALTWLRCRKMKSKRQRVSG